MRLILEHKESRHPQDLIALVCNLACHPHGADIICGEPAEDTNDGGGIGLRLLLKRALKTGDPLLWKLIRTLATTSTSARASFLPFIDDLGKMFMVVHGNSIGYARNSASADDSLALMADLLGIFSCLASLEDFDYVQLNSSFKLLDACSVHLLNALHPSSTRAIGSSSTDALPLPATIHPDDDVALECVLLIGSMLSADNQMPSVLASYQCRDMSTSRGVTLLQLLVRLLIAKPEDQEFTLQVLHVLYLCLVADATREALLGDSPHIASYLLEIRSSDGDARGGTVPYILEIRTLADNCLDIIMDDNAHRVGAGRDTALLSLDIQQQRFLRNNAHWLERAGVSVDAE